MRNVKICCSLLLLLLLAACVSRRSVQTQHFGSSVYSGERARDSIFIHDSIVLRERNDTVFLTRWRTRYRDCVRCDTLLVRDTVRIENYIPAASVSGADESRGFSIRFWLPAIVVFVILWKCGIFDFFARKIKNM